jgi:methionyl-tRNA formyltransferase
LSLSSTPPLRILFCGSDEFSCASLRALDAVRRGSKAKGAVSSPSPSPPPPPLVESIEVVVRPGKRTGRGLRTVRHVPLQQLAEELGLTMHVRDTFTGWSVSCYSVFFGPTMDSARGAVVGNAPG